MAEQMHMRTELMFGVDGMKRLRAAHVMIVGVGGVGGATAEMLARAGIGYITLVDADVIQTSNINRQLIALHSNVGMPKVTAWKTRLLDINPDLQITVYQDFLDETNTAQILTSTKIDFVVDAIDTISPKVFLIKQCFEKGISIISSMGSGGKTNPSKICLTDISKTEYCALAKTVRTRLSKMNIKKGIPCVFSTELVDKKTIIPTEGELYKKSTTGTVSYIPNIFGCWIAGYVIRELQK